MSKHLKIKALFFLGIFSVILLHQVIPHQHHEHHGEDEHCEFSYHHNQDHAESKDDHASKGFLHWFLASHLHTNSIADVFGPEQLAKMVSSEKELAQIFPCAEEGFVYFEISTKNKTWCYFQDKLPDLHAPNPALRGPPSLG